MSPTFPKQVSVDLSSTPAPCPQCREESPLYCRVGDVNRKTTKEEFDYFRCPSCGIVFLWPVPDGLDRYYPNDYYAIPHSLEAFSKNAKLEQYKVDIMQRFASGGRLLEIGPAYGSFTYLAKQAGFDVDAIEMNGACCRFMIDVLGVRATHSLDTDAALRNSGVYDVIALWHVVEHLPDPWASLKLLAQHLNPGGVLIIAAPNPRALQFKLLRRFWTHLDAPRHLELIPSNVLSEQARQLGLIPVLITTADRGSLGWNKFGWEMSLANFLTNRYGRWALRQCGRIISKVTAPLERVNGFGSAYTVVFRKERNE